MALLLFVAGLMVAGLFGLWFLSRHLNNQAASMVKDTRVLLVTVPKDIARKGDEAATDQAKDFKEEMAPAEQMFTSFYSVFDDSFLRQLTEEQDILGFEIVSHDNIISFYITCHKKLIPLVERQIHSTYSDANIEVVPGHNIFENNQGIFSAATVSLRRRFIYPIRTFRYLEIDPLNNLTNSMSKLSSGQAAAIQLLIKPISQRWRFQPAHAAKQVLDGKNNFMHDHWWERFMHSIFESMSKKGESEKQGGGFHQKTPGQEELMKVFNEKASKIGYKAQVRIVTVAQDLMTANIIRDSIAASFSQFNTPAWNSFKVHKSHDSRRTVTDYILRNFANGPQMLLNTEELASLFHLPTKYTDTPNIRWLKSRTLAAPPNLPNEGTIIGESVFRSEVKPVRIKEDDRRRHIFMLGKTGVGKTTLFENMIDQDILNGKGVCFIDPLGDAIESILKKIPKERAEDVVLFDPGDTDRPMGLNLLEWKRPEEKDFLIAEWLEIFYKLFDPNRTGMVGPQFEHWGRNAALTVMSMPDGGTLLDIPRLFTDDAFMKEAVSHVTDPVVKAFWEQQMAKTADFHKSEMYNYFISKFGRFMTNDLMRNIIGQTKSAFDIREIMDSGKILLINLAKGKIGDMNSNLLGLILVSKIQTAAFSRVDTPEEQRKDFYLYVDEFQNFTTDTFATILSEARKYRLNLNITNQYIAQLSEHIRDAVIGNAGTMITYRIGAADAEFMAKEFPGVTIDDMVNLERFTTYVKELIDATPTLPFSMRGILSPIKKNPEMGEAIRQLSRLKYGQDKDMINSEFAKRMVSAQLPEAGINEPISRT
jgi:hypothetical protein